MRALLSLCFAAGLVTQPAGRVSQPSDLDQFMERVLATRDQNWKKLQQYILDEHETFDVVGPGGAPLYGMRREYSWFMQDGIFVRSPLSADGVALSEADRRKAEAEFIAHERAREKRNRERTQKAAADSAGASPSVESAPSSAPSTASASASASASVSASAVEPYFVSAAYFLRFKFEPGHYALAGREAIEGRQALKIEYYPEQLFREGRARPNKRVRERDRDIETKMNKVSLVTLWIDPDAYQILQYTFDDIDMDFMPGRSLVRVDDLRATMHMAQAFPGVWLPKAIDMHFAMTLAVGTVDAQYRVQYHDYREAGVTSRIRPPGE
jgi:hypothetical protein